MNIRNKKELTQAYDFYSSYAEIHSLEDTIIKVIIDNTDAESADSILPCGMSVRDAAVCIAKQSKLYVSNRDSMITEGKAHSDEVVRKKIWENLSQLEGEDLNQEKAINYLCLLSVFLNHLGFYESESLTEESLKDEVEKLKNQYIGMEKQEIIDQMMDSLKIRQASVFLNKCNEIFEEIQENENYTFSIQDVVSDNINDQLSACSEHFVTVKSAAIRSALIYSSITKGEFEDTPPEINPGLVVAEYAATTDMIMVSVFRHNKIISSEATDVLVEILGIAFAVVLYSAVLAAILLVAGGGFELIIIAGRFLLSLGLAQDITVALMSLLIFLWGYCCVETFKDTDSDMFDNIEKNKALFINAFYSLKEKVRTSKNNHQKSRRKNYT